MDPAILSLLALVGALVVSMTSRINVGWLAIAFAWLVGIYAAGLRPDVVLAGFPAALFLTLAGVTLLFGIAETNGTLEGVATRALTLTRGRVRAVPIVLFVVACLLSSVGPGAISTVALLAPMAMSVGARAGTLPLLTALMVANGANAGNLSPFSSVGVIANGAMAKAGLVDYEGQVWFANFAAHLLVGAAAFAWLGLRAAPSPEGTARQAVASPRPFTRQQQVTLAVIGVWIVGVLVLNIHLGFSAFAAAVVLLIFRAADESVAARRIPWPIIMMVCGVSVLIGVLEQTGGMDLFTGLLARVSSPGTLNGVIAFVTGTISTYSSTSGVVLPAFLPTAASLVERVGGGDPLAVALSINVGSSLVDVSPLSTIGALCVAAVGDAAARPLFRALLIWGLSMTVVGAVICQVFAPMFARL
jgi:di/tricarboxylate transporter